MLRKTLKGWYCFNATQTFNVLLGRWLLRKIDTQLDEQLFWQFCDHVEEDLDETT